MLRVARLPNLQVDRDAVAQVVHGFRPMPPRVQTERHQAGFLVVLHVGGLNLEGQRVTGEHEALVCGCLGIDAHVLIRDRLERAQFPRRVCFAGQRAPRNRARKAFDWCSTSGKGTWGRQGEGWVRSVRRRGAQPRHTRHGNVRCNASRTSRSRPERSKILTRKVQLCSVRHGVMAEGELQLVPLAVRFGRTARAWLINARRLLARA